MGSTKQVGKKEAFHIKGKGNMNKKERGSPEATMGGEKVYPGETKFAPRGHKRPLELGAREIGIAVSGHGQLPAMQVGGGEKRRLQGV